MQAQCEEDVRRELQRPFDLGSGELLLCGVLVRLTLGDHVLVVNQHHIVSDVLSLRKKSVYDSLIWSSQP